MSDIDENTVYSLAVEEHLFGKKDAVNTNENAYNDNASHISSWTKAYDRQGNEYYYDEATGHSQWDVPEGTSPSKIAMAK